MLERTYVASRFSEALDKIKKELGPEAVILSSRSIAPGGMDRHARVEVRAALQREGLVRKAPSAFASGGASVEGQRSRRMEKRMLQAGVPFASAKRIAQEVSQDPGHLDAWSRAVSNEVVFAGSTKRSEARVVALVGPTGVGKTTTVAKLAANAALIKKWKVALISLDHYRLGGVEQLAQYAELIGVPLETASDGRSLQAAVRRHRDADLILVDTAGRSPNSIAALRELSDCLGEAGEVVQTHLCVAAGTRDEDLQMIIEKMSVLHPARLIITKLDETRHHGAVIAAHVWSDLPLSYFTTGQRVPEDVEVAKASRLGTLLCKGGDWD